MLNLVLVLLKQSIIYTVHLFKCQMKNILYKIIYIYIYSQVHKYWDIDTILTFLALYTTTMDLKWNEQDVL